jgi:hypothetical protein
MMVLIVEARRQRDEKHCQAAELQRGAEEAIFIHLYDSLSA